MFSKILISLLLISLIACPIRCGGCSPDVAEGAEATEIAFACCGACNGGPQPAGPQPAGPQPAGQPAPENDAECSCQDCICNGALLVDTPVEVSVTSPATCWLTIRLHDGAVSDTVGSDFFRQVIRNASTPGGIDARIAYQSWQL